MLKWTVSLHSCCSLIWFEQYSHFQYSGKLWKYKNQTYLSEPFQQHSNLSKMQSFSYREQSLLRRYSWTLKYTSAEQYKEIFHSSVIHFSLFFKAWTLYLVGLYWPVFHIQIPYFNWKIVPGHHVSTAVTEFYIWYWRYYFWKEWSAAGIFRLLKDWKLQDRNENC